MLAATNPDWIFVPWDQIDTLESVDPVVILFVLLGGLVGYYFYQRRRDRLREEGRVRAELAKRSSLRGLTEAESEALIDSITRSRATSPKSAVSSEPYFREFVARVLARRYGDDVALRVRDKLFRQPPPRVEEEASEAAEGVAAETAEEEVQADPEQTRRLRVGQQMRLTFEDFVGSVPAVVINVKEEGFLVGLIAGGGQNLDRRPRLRVAGVFTEGTALLSFRGEVLEFVEGKMLACRIAHTHRVARLRDRAETRVKLLRPARFLHLSEADMTSGSVADAGRASSIHEAHEAQLRDISLGGCALTTAADLPFTKGDHLHVTCALADGASPVACLGRLVGHNPFGKGERMLHVEFEALDDETRQTIALAMARAQEKAPPAAGPGTLT